MANEIQVVHDQTAETLRAVIRRPADGWCWNTNGVPAFEARTVANWAKYLITLTETSASSYFYVGTFPAGIAAGFYFVDIYVLALSTPADFRIASQFGRWTGTAFLFDPVTLANAAHGGAAATITLATPIAATVPDAQKVDVHTIKTKPVAVDAGGTTFPATIASPGDVTTAHATTDGKVDTAKASADAAKASADEAARPGDGMDTVKLSGDPAAADNLKAAFAGKKKYWYKTGANTYWSNLANWWDDAAHTVQSTVLPATGNFVYLRGPISPTTGPAATLFLSGFDTQGLTEGFLSPEVTANIVIQSGGTLTMGARVYPAGPVCYHWWQGKTAALGVFTFNDGCGVITNGVVGDYATFNDYSYCDIGTIGDHATFNDESRFEYTFVASNYPTFNDSSYNNALVGDYATFNDESYNVGGGAEAGVGDYATFNDNSRNVVGEDSSGEVGDYATFNDNSRNESVVGSSAIFRDGSSNREGGTVGNAETGTCYFYDYATNLGTVLGEAEYHNTALASVCTEDRLARLDATVGSRATPSDVTEAHEATRTAIKGGTRTLENLATPADVRTTVLPGTLQVRAGTFTLQGASQQTLDFPAGYASTLPLRLVDADGEPVDLSEADLVLRAVKADGEDLFVLAEGDGITKPEAEDGQFTLRFSAEQAEAGRHKYELGDSESVTLYAKGDLVFRETFGLEPES